MHCLTDLEMAWLDEFQKNLDLAYPGLVRNIAVFGSKARGDAREDSDLDLLIVIREGDWRLKKAVSKIGHDRAPWFDTVPSMVIYTENEYKHRLDCDDSFVKTVREEGVTVR